MCRQTTHHDTSHGSPYDRGSMDKYYGRPFFPHYYTDPRLGYGQRIEKAGMTQDQLQAYADGYKEEDDEKDWGGPDYGQLL